MIITSLGSAYWPQSPEGRVLCLLVAIYGFCVFGYLTATLASYFLGHESRAAASDRPSEPAIEALREEIALLREEIAALRESKR
jgi:voltage-gated potassium channel